MKPVGNYDYYQCRACYGHSGVDYACLTDFYLPLIGADAYASYLALCREEISARLHEDLLKVLDLTPGEFEKAIEALEAGGLVRTFVGEQEGRKLFLYCLYAPLHAGEFASDIMLAGTLKGKIGEANFARLYSRHQGDYAPDDMEEVSVSFPTHFNKAYDASFYLGVQSKGKSLGKAEAKTGFDSSAFLEKTEALGLRKNAISEEELSDIAKLASLYGLSETTMAEAVLECLRINMPRGKKVDIQALSRKASAMMPFTYFRKEEGASSDVSGDTILAQKVRMMDQMSPAKFLSMLQNGHKPAEADLKLIERLNLQIGLPSPCINALLDYVLQTKNNTLPAAYCEKLAASLVREGCRTSRDAMDYLKRGNRGRKKTIPVTPGGSVAPTETKPASEAGDKDLDALIDEALADLYKD